MDDIERDWSHVKITTQNSCSCFPLPSFFDWGDSFPKGYQQKQLQVFHQSVMNHCHIKAQSF